MCEADRQLSGRVAGCDLNCGQVKHGCPALNMPGSELSTAVKANDTRHSFSLSDEGIKDAETRADGFYRKVEAALAAIQS